MLADSFTCVSPLATASVRNADCDNGRRANQGDLALVPPTPAVSGMTGGDGRVKQSLPEQHGSGSEKRLDLSVRFANFANRRRQVRGRQSSHQYGLRADVLKPHSGLGRKRPGQLQPIRINCVTHETDTDVVID